MKKLLFIIAFLFTTALSFAQSHVWVNGYTRSNGTYVTGHYRTAPNYTRNDNWTTKGNTNPYTGKAGILPGDRYSSTQTSSSYYPTSSYSTPSYSRETYTSSYYVPTPSYSSSTYSSSPTIYTGSRGGQYYINSNGNKTYINN